VSLTVTIANALATGLRSATNSQATNARTVASSDIKAIAAGGRRKRRTERTERKTSGRGK
jgi:hypothetical protein